MTDNPERIWADRADRDLAHFPKTPFGVWWHDKKGGSYDEYVRADLARARLEAAEAMAADYKIMRAEMAELAEYILKRDGPGLSDYEARGIFADLQRARFRSDPVFAAWHAAQKGSDDE